MEKFYLKTNEHDKMKYGEKGDKYGHKNKILR